jgi:hypothetical protein
MELFLPILQTPPPRGGCTGRLPAEACAAGAGGGGGGEREREREREAAPVSSQALACFLGNLNQDVHRERRTKQDGGRNVAALVAGWGPQRCSPGSGKLVQRCSPGSGKLVQRCSPGSGKLVRGLCLELPKNPRSLSGIRARSHLNNSSHHNVFVLLAQSIQLATCPKMQVRPIAGHASVCPICTKPCMLDLSGTCAVLMVRSGATRLDPPPQLGCNIELIVGCACALLFFGCAP